MILITEIFEISFLLVAQILVELHIKINVQRLFKNLLSQPVDFHKALFV